MMKVHLLHPQLPLLLHLLILRQLQNLLLYQALLLHLLKMKILADIPQKKEVPLFHLLLGRRLLT